MVVYLRVKGDRKLSLTIKVIEWGLELEYKNCFAVANNGLGKAVVLHHYVNNYFCKSWSIDGDFDQFMIYHFSQTVNNDKTQVITVAFLIGRH